MRVLCTICAREGSKGIKNKNLINFNNDPLIIHTLKQAKKIKFFNNIVVSTDSKIIKNLVGKKYSWFLRAKKISNDKSSKVSAIKHAMLLAEKKFKCKYDILVDLDVTSPLRNLSDIKKSYIKFKKFNYDNLFTVCLPRKNPYFNIVELKNTKKSNYAPIINKKKFFSRQTSPVVYEMNAAIYIWKRSSILSNKPLFNNNGIFVMPRERSFDIDDKLDLKIVKFLKR